MRKMLTSKEINVAADRFNAWLDIRDRRSPLNDHTKSNDAALIHADEIRVTTGGDRLMTAMAVCNAARKRRIKVLKEMGDA